MKQELALSTVNSIASIKSRYGHFACDISEKDTRKVFTIMFLNKTTQKLVPFAEIPATSRSGVIKMLNILASYAKACERFESVKGVKLTLDHKAFVDLLTSRTSGKAVTGGAQRSNDNNNKESRKKRRSLWG